MDTRRWLLLAAIAAQGCGGYYASDAVTFGTVVYTQPAPNADFKPLRTYYLDLTMDVFKDGAQQPSVAVPDSTVQVIATRMTAYGYTRVGAGQALPPPNANVGLRLTLFNNSVTYYYSWCSPYWGYYGCYPYWGYGGTYTTGSVATLMVDLRQTPPPGPPAGQRPVLWANALYAVKYSTTPDAVTRLNNGLNTAFDLSPFLKTSAVP